MRTSLPSSSGRAVIHHNPPARWRGRHCAPLRKCTATAWAAERQPAPASAPLEASPSFEEAILLATISGHDSALLSAKILSDRRSGPVHCVSSSLDKSIVHFSLSEGTEPGTQTLQETKLISVESAPIFSLATHQRSDNLLRTMYLGTTNSILAWDAPSHELQADVNVGGHTGWVRAMCTSGDWLFSGSCSELRMWDLSWGAQPKAMTSITQPSGDILAVVCDKKHVFTASSDGVLRSWEISKACSGTGRQCHMFHPAQQTAHTKRMPSLCVADGVVYTVSLDGDLKAWDATTLEPLGGVLAAHDGTKIHCIKMGPDGLLYTGGDDKLVRRWALERTPAGVKFTAATELFCHSHPVRVLAAGDDCCMLSGDSSGQLALWDVAPLGKFQV